MRFVTEGTRITPGVLVVAECGCGHVIVEPSETLVMAAHTQHLPDCLEPATLMIIGVYDRRVCVGL